MILFGINSEYILLILDELFELFSKTFYLNRRQIINRKQIINNYRFCGFKIYTLIYWIGYKSLQNFINILLLIRLKSDQLNAIIWIRLISIREFQ